jgi:hypothetical protein
VPTRVPRRVLALVVLAFILVALGAGLAAGLGPSRIATPVASIVVRSNEPTAVPTSRPTTTRPTIAPAAGSYLWALVSSTGEVAKYSVGPAIRRRDGSLLAVGVTLAGLPRVLASSDGRTWTIDDADPSLAQAPALHFSIVNGLAEGATSLVAVGAAALEDVSSGDARAWSSTDGVHWRAAVASNGMSDASMEGVAAGPDEFVAVGSDGFPGGNTQLPGARGAAVWRSSDGTTWSRVPNQKSFAGAVMFGIRRTPSGYVAWGEVHDPAGTGAQRPPIWTSVDGLTWERATGIADAGGPGNPIASILPLGGRLIAVGSRPSDANGFAVPAMWSSSDGGRTWGLFAAPDHIANPVGSGSLRDIAVAGSDVLAVGLSESRPGDQGSDLAITWLSADDGATWKELAPDPSLGAAIVTRLVAIHSGFVAFGSTNDPNAYANANLIWVGVPQP